MEQMSEEEFRDIFCKYVVSEMDLLPEPEDVPEHPSYSRKFNRKMKQLMRAGDNFGGSLRVYNLVRRAAAVLLVILSLAVANQASAAIFGFNPWEEVNKLFRGGIGMEQKSYEKSNLSPNNAIKPISDVPTYVPDGYEEIDCQVGESIITMEWEKIEEDGSKHGMTYSREMVDEHGTYLEDVEYDSVYTISVMSYIAKIYIKNDETWIRWKDMEYRYMILVNGTSNEKSVLERIAESIYEKK